MFVVAESDSAAISQALDANVPKKRRDAVAPCAQSGYFQRSEPCCITYPPFKRTFFTASAVGGLDLRAVGRPRHAAIAPFTALGVSSPNQGFHSE
ncbi:MAG: hypothetical protein IJL92_02930 [Thermoguttaceae bacterium]|nr:hypothetical protein [Thermoguttaceae bacterium]